MLNRTTRVAAGLTLLLVAGCEPSMQAISSKSAADPVARRTIELVQLGRTVEALVNFEPSVLPNNAVEVFAGMRRVLPESSTASIELVFWRWFKSLVQDRVDETCVFHVKGRARSALVFITARTESGKTLLTGFRAQAAPANLWDANPFRLRGMSLVQYALLISAVIVPLFMLGTALACVRSTRRRKWLWVPFIIVGIGKFGVQCVAGGQFFLQPLMFQLLGVTVFKFPVYEPWVVAVSLPLGALVYWITNRKAGSSPPELSGAV